MSLHDLLNRYISTRRLKPKTISVYRTTLRQFGDHLGHVPTLDDLTDGTLLAFEAWLAPGRSPYTVRERAGRLRALWRFAAQYGLIARWPSSPPLHVPDVRPTAYTVDEIRRLLRACDATSQPLWWRAWVLTAFATGERTGALRRTCWQHVDLGRRTLDLPGEIRKGGRPALHYLTREAADAISQLTRTSPLVWPWPRSESLFFKSFNALLDSAGLPPGRRNQTQRIRRSHLTYWHAGGGDATERAGHSSSSVTWRHYLDRSLLPHDDPDERLPRVV